MVEKKEQETEYEIVDVPVEFGKVIQKKDGTKISDVELLVELANKIDKIDKRL